jgi:transglutaminase-like putative cysteine protease
MSVQVEDFIDVHPDAPFTLVQDLPDDVLPYLLPSRYCQSDMLLDLATKIAGKAQPGYAQVAAIRDWIHSSIKYKYGSSGPSTSAVDTAKSRKGVCRDFSHLGIAFCRALRIPARMVSGYLYQLDPMDLHAWFEAFVGGRWYTFDATQEEARGNRIVVAYGRDAADIAQMSEYGTLKVTEMKAYVNAAP